MRYSTTLKRTTSGIVLILMAVSLVGVVATVVQAATANQFSKKLTNPDDVMAGGVVGKVDLHLKNVQGIAVVNKNRMAAYYSKSLGTEDADGNLIFKTKSSMKLKITKGRDAGYCKIPSNADGRIQVVIANRTVFDKPTTEVCSKFIGATINFPNNVSIDNDASGFFKAEIEVRLTGRKMSPSELGGKDTDGYSLNYAMELVDSYGAKSKLALQGNTGSDEFGFRSAYRSNPPSNRQVKSGGVFGFPCDINPTALPPAKRSVKLYDPDAVFGMTYMWIEKNSRPIERSDYDTDLNRNIKAGGWDETTRRWTVDPGNRTTAIVGLKAKKSVIDVKAEYRLMVLNTGKKADGSNSGASPHYNTLSFSIPFDSIYGADKCNYTLTPRVNPPKDSKSTVPAGASIPVTGRVGVEGFDDDAHAWKLTKRIYSSNQPMSRVTNGQFPCDWKPGIAGTCADLASGNNKTFGSTDFAKPVSFNTSGLEAGDWVCFMMSVQKPTYNGAGSRWAHSPMKCVGINGNPTGTTVNDQTYSYYPSLRVTSIIKNTEGYPKRDNFKNRNHNRDGYKWRLMETKFSARPTGGVGNSASGGACGAIEDKYASIVLSGSCTVIKEGDNLFPTAGDPAPISVSTKDNSKTGKGPDPIGTWTCYTLSYRKNPPPSEALESDIKGFRSDWNDEDAKGQPGRWGDGRYYVEPVKNKKGKVIKAGYWVGDKAPSYNSLYNPYLNASPVSSPSRFVFTPYQNSCSQSGVDPKVQIRNGDLKIAGGGISTFVRTMEVGNAVGSYGSGSEYGVLSTGLNTGMASGSGMLRGLASGNQTDWSKLTFTNDNPSMRGFGKFDATPSDSKPAVPPGAIELGAEGVTTEDTAFNESVPFQKGKKLVYHVNGTLRITRNLTYTNSMDRVNEIPRIVIYAENIEIAPNVKRIDPWLIADNISTCGPPRGAAWGDHAGEALGDANLYTKMCSEPLIFNGPVYADNLYLYRTGGSRVPKGQLDLADYNRGWKNPDATSPVIDSNDYCEGTTCGGTRYALSAPAEVFNLRPDVFLSSFSGKVNGVPVATTDKITELPPRF